MPAVETTGVITSATRTYQAGVFPLKRGVAVVQGADDAHVVPAGANAAAFGIVEEDTIALDSWVSVVRIGEAVAVAGAAITAGSPLVANASGQLVPSTAIGDNVVARAVSSASAVGDYLVVFVLPFIR